MYGFPGLNEFYSPGLMYRLARPGVFKICRIRSFSETRRSRFRPFAGFHL